MNADGRPNILFIMTDQQSAYLMSCTGNDTLRTPALDRLAASGVRFERAYASNPVCVPSRFSLQTGRMPSAIHQKWNEDLPVPQSMIDSSLGTLFNSAGYETVYAGKIHLPGDLKHVEQCGYRLLTTDRRQGCVDACCEFLKGAHEKPFFLFASFVNPHDICYLTINDAFRAQGKDPIDNDDSQICEEVAEESRRIAASPDWDELLTPLPDNHEISESEPEAITTHYLPQPHSGALYRVHARTNWRDKEWRILRHTYRRLVEMVDEKIGQVLDALDEAGLAENTLVVFTSDHGDMDAAHRLQHKSVLYDECSRIPFIMSQKGVIPQGVVDDEHLVSNGLDLLPTLCDAAQIPCPGGLSGRSVLPVARGDKNVERREYVVTESLHGRMVRTDRYKYSIYGSGAHREQLVDMHGDPGEMNNLADNPDHVDELDRHRRLLAEWVTETGDSIAANYIIRD